MTLRDFLDKYYNKWWKIKDPCVTISKLREDYGDAILFFFWIDVAGETIAMELHFYIKGAIVSARTHPTYVKMSDVIIPDEIRAERVLEEL
ncbi:MAG: hypothetical protein ACTSPB_24790 [Candidatus Thorarchaeota archaeon]